MQEHANGGRPTFVLVHGGHHGAWAWERLQSVLEGKGWRTVAVDLPTAVKDLSLPEPLPGIHDDAKIIRDALQQIPGPAIVVAHSYGGVPATEAVADAPNVVHIVFVAAYMLDVGESMFGTHGAPTPESIAGLRPPENPDINLPAAFFDGDPTNPETAEASARLVPQTIRGDFETITRAGWKQIPNSYVIPDNDVSLTGTVADAMSARADTVYRTPGHHAPFYSHPSEFADLLIRIAESSSPSTAGGPEKGA